MFSTATLLFRDVSVRLYLNINFLYDDVLKKIENIIETLKSWTGSKDYHSLIFHPAC